MHIESSFYYKTKGAFKDDKTHFKGVKRGLRKVVLAMKSNDYFVTTKELILKEIEQSSKDEIASIIANLRRLNVNLDDKLTESRLTVANLKVELKELEEEQIDAEIEVNNLNESVQTLNLKLLKKESNIKSFEQSNYILKCKNKELEGVVLSLKSKLAMNESTLKYKDTEIGSLKADVVKLTESKKWLESIAKKRGTEISILKKDVCK